MGPKNCHPSRFAWHTKVSSVSSDKGVECAVGYMSTSRGRGVSQYLDCNLRSVTRHLSPAARGAGGQSDRQSDTKKKSVPQNAIDVQAPGSFASVHARLLIRKSHGFLRTNRCQACSHSKGEWVHLRAGLWPVLHSTDSQGNRGRVRANGSIIASSRRG